MRALLRWIVSRQRLNHENSLVKSIRAKAPHAKGAIIFFHKGLGDLVLALPALRAFSALGPIRLFLADDRFVPLLARYGIDSRQVFGYGKLKTWLTLLFRKYDYCVNFDSTYISYVTRIMMILANSKLNVGYDSGPLERLIQLGPVTGPPEAYVGTQFDNLAKCLGGTPSTVASQPVENKEGPIVFHVGGRLDETGFDKRWPVHKFVELAERCAGLGHSVKILWGPGDPMPRATSRVEVQHCLSTDTLLAVIGEAKLFVCNNTGVLWVACLLGVKTISFGTPFFLPKWDPRVFRRETNHVLMGNEDCRCTEYHCQAGNCLQDLSVERVLQYILEKSQISPRQVASEI